MRGQEQAGTSRLRVAVLTNAIPAYRFPVFATLAQSEDFDLRVFLSLPLEKSDPRARLELPLRYSRSAHVRWRTRHRDVDRDQVESLPIPLRLSADLLAYRPHVVISGEFGLRSLVGYVMAKLTGSTFVIWSEEIAETARNVSNLQRRLRGFLIPRARAFLAWGQPAAAYLRSQGVPERAIYHCAQSVDNAHWIPRSYALDRVRIRAEFGWRGRVFLTVAQLIPRKGIDLLIDAWGALPEEIKARNALVIVGAGPDEAQLRARAQAQQGAHIAFAGFQPPEQLIRYYAAADVFVFPSLVDVWGLVVNEAMACGLPVLVSRYAGSGQELLAGGNVGEAFDPRDAAAFTAMLLRWCMRGDLPERDVPRTAIAHCHAGVTVEAIQRLIRDHAPRAVHGPTEAAP